MAFKLAEAFIELKARGEKEVHKAVDKTKEKVKEIGPAAEQAEKKLEKAVTDAAKEVTKSADKMATSLNKPIDKLAEFEKEWKAAMGGAQKELKKLDDAIKSPSTGGGALGEILGGNRNLFGKFAGFAQAGAGAGLIGIAGAIGARANNLETTGGDSPVLGRELSAVVREVVAGLKVFGAAVKDVGMGFVDSLLGLIAMASQTTLPGRIVRGIGQMSNANEAADAMRKSDYLRAIEGRKAIDRNFAAVDPMGPIREMERRAEIDAMMKAGGVDALEGEASRLQGSVFSDIQTAEQVRAINERIVQEKEKAARAGEQAAEAAEREVAALAKALDKSRAGAVQGAHMQRRINEMAFLTGRSPESIEAQLRLNLNRDQVGSIDKELAGRDKFKGFIATQQDVENFAAKAGERASAMDDEGSAAAKLRREYEELAAQVAGMPAGAGRDAAMAALNAAAGSVDALAAGELLEQEGKRRQQADEDRIKAAGEERIDAIRARGDEERFGRRNVARPTTSFQMVDVADFAKQLQADIFAKEDEEMRVQEEKKMHEEDLKQAKAIEDAVKGVKDEIKNQVARAG